MKLFDRRRGWNTRIDVYHINDKREEARCGSCRARIQKSEGWNVNGNCEKCGIGFDCIVVRS